MTPPPARLDAELLLAQTGWVRALARALVRDPSRAEDVAQEALLAAVARPPTEARTELLLRAWLARVVRNLARFAARGEARRSERERDAARADRAPAADEIVARADGHRRVVEAVMALDEPLRTAVLLRYFDGLDHRAIAARTRTTPAAARKRVSRGLAELRERLDRESHGDRASWMSALAPLAALPTGGTIMGIKTLAGASAALVALAAIGLWATREPSASLTAADDVRTSDALLVAPIADDGETEREAARAASEREPVVATEPPHAPAPAPGRGTLVVEVTWSDGTPAAGVVVRVFAWGAPDPFHGARFLASDRNGRARLDDVHPGHVVVYADRGGSVSAELAAGEERVMRLAIPLGTTVEGRVVDEHGIAVARAEVWTLYSGIEAEELAAALTDAAGRFRLRDLAPHRSLAASAPRHAPSGRYEVPAQPGGTVEMELRLRGAGGAVRGRVLDPMGAPAAGARIQLDSRDRRLLVDADGRALRQPPMRRARADADGQFAVEGLQTGRMTLAVVHDQAATHTETVAVEAWSTTRVEVMLELDAVVEGTLRDEAGSPVEDAFVGVGSTARTLTASDGFFRLTRLPAGTADVRVDADERGGARATLMLETGATTRWDPVLVRGDSVGGVLVDEAGGPLAGWRVAAVKPDHIGLWHRETRSADDGTFLLESLPDGELLIEVREPAAFPGDPTVLAELERGRRDVRIVAPHDALLSARVAGRFVGPEGGPLERLEIWLVSQLTRQGTLLPHDEAGAFAAGPLRPASYTITAQVDGMVRYESDVFELAPDETLDLGVVVLQPGGFVRATIRLPEGRAGEHVSCTVIDESGRTEPLIKGADGSAQSRPLLPGTYTIFAGTTSLGAEPRTLEVAARETTHVELELVPAATHVLTFELPEGSAERLDMRVEVRDAAGALAWADARGPQPRDGDASFWAHGLHAGTYSVHGESDQGLSATGTFTIDDVAAPRGESRFVLR